jgi:ribosomal protein S6--L-glutamate ligase
MKAAILSLGSVSSEMTAQAMRTYFTLVDEMDIRHVHLEIGKNPRIVYKGRTLGTYDCMYVKGSYKYAQLAASIAGLLPSSTYTPIPKEAYEIVHNKALTHIVLQKAGIPMPTTYIVPNAQVAKEVFKSMSFPIIIKLPSGTQGKGVLFAESIAAASSILDTLESLKQAFIVQEYIDTNGEDIRALVVGNKVVASMKRIAKSDEKRSNLHAGGMAQSVQLSPQVTSVAIAVARALKLDICGVDILVSPKGPLVIEANISPGLQGISKASGVSVADLLARFFATRCGIAQESISADSLVREPLDIIDTIKYRGTRIMLPESVSLKSEFLDGEEAIFDVKEKNIHIRKI